MSTIDRGRRQVAKEDRERTVGMNFNQAIDLLRAEHESIVQAQTMLFGILAIAKRQDGFCSEPAREALQEVYDVLTRHTK